ncbi:MAG TPA: hypothetical protein VK689_12900 [Armatimonadota bacterium]|nr:hypothetical protein [Armatimonadota bacterium]
MSPPPRRIALLYAVRQELAPMARVLRPSREKAPALRYYPQFFGEVGGAQVLLAAGGVGARRAAEAADELLQAWTPDLLLMTGVAGALSPELQVGDVIVGDAVETGDARLVPSLVPSGDNSTAGVTAGTLLSIDRVLVTPEEKHAAAGNGALAVEMETAAVAGVAGARSVPWAAVRAVSDTASEGLPLDFNRLRDPEGDLPTSRVALAALAQPSSIPGLLRLGRNTSTASEALARFLAAWIAGGE